MADLADVMDLLETIVVGAVYPNGTDQSSVSGSTISVGQGWPIAKDVDAAMAASTTLVSVYAEPSTTSPAVTPINTYYTAVAAVPGTQVAVNEAVVTLSGTPTAGEVVVLLVDGVPYPYSVRAGDTPTTVAAALYALVQPTHPDVITNGASVEIDSSKYLSCAVSALGKVAHKLHTQRSQFQIVVWSPSPADRTAVARAVDVAVKTLVRRPVADTTSVLLSYQGTNLRDKEENEGVFRRDVLVNAVYETIEIFDGQSVVAAELGFQVTGTPSPVQVPFKPTNPPAGAGSPASVVAPVGGGWVRYSQSSTAAPVQIAAGVRTLISFVVDPTQTQDFLNPPFEGRVSYDGTKATPYQMGDFYSFLINLFITPQVTGGLITFDIDVGSSAGPTVTDDSQLGDAGVKQRVSGKLFSADLANFAANGARFYITPTVPITVQNEAITITPLSTRGGAPT